MKRFRPRFTVARLMIVVAVAGLAIGIPIAIEHRRASRLEIATAHEAEATKNGWGGQRFGFRRLKPVTGIAEEKALSDLMFRKAVYH